MKDSNTRTKTKKAVTRETLRKEVVSLRLL